MGSKRWGQRLPRFGSEITRWGQRVLRFGSEISRWGQRVARFGSEITRWGQRDVLVVSIGKSVLPIPIHRKSMKICDRSDPIHIDTKTR